MTQDERLRFLPVAEQLGINPSVVDPTKPLVERQLEARAAVQLGLIHVALCHIAHVQLYATPTDQTEALNQPLVIPDLASQRKAATFIEATQRLTTITFNGTSSHEPLSDLGSSALAILVKEGGRTAESRKLRERAKAILEHDSFAEEIYHKNRNLFDINARAAEIEMGNEEFEQEEQSR